MVERVEEMKDHALRQMTHIGGMEKKEEAVGLVKEVRSEERVPSIAEDVAQFGAGKGKRVAVLVFGEEMGVDGKAGKG